MKKNKTVIVKKSTIPQAGKGVFANKKIKKGQVVGIFKGYRVKKNGIHVLWLADDYAIQVTNNMKFVNHSKDGNSELRGTVLYVIKDIKKNEEIFFDYNEAVDEVF